MPDDLIHSCSTDLQLDAMPAMMTVLLHLIPGAAWCTHDLVLQVSAPCLPNVFVTAQHVEAC